MLAHRFKRDVDRLKKPGEDMVAFKAVADAICSGEPLAPEFGDHVVQLFNVAQTVSPTSSRRS